MDGVLSQEEINALLNNPGASSDTADGQLLALIHISEPTRP